MIDDLILTRSGDKQEMSAVVDGELVGPVPGKGAIPKLANMALHRAHGDRYDHELLDDVIGQMSLMHFNNLRRGENRAGQGYPLVLTEAK